MIYPVTVLDTTLVTCTLLSGGAVAACDAEHTATSKTATIPVVLRIVPCVMLNSTHRSFGSNALPAAEGGTFTSQVTPEFSSLNILAASSRTFGLLVLVFPACPRTK